MSRLEPQFQRLRAAILPLKAYAKQQRGRPNLSPFGMNHIGEIEAALNAVADYAAAAEAILNPEPDAFIVRVRAHLQQQHMQTRLGYPTHIREVLASYSAFHLPRNPALDELAR